MEIVANPASALLLLALLISGLVALILIPLWNLRLERGLRKVRAPPGCLGWPLLGETLDFMASYRSSDPDYFLRTRISRYGKVFSTHLFGKPTVISVDVEVNRIIMNNEGALFLPDYPKSLNDLWGKWTILRLEGVLHKRLHAIMAQLFKSHAFKASLYQHFTDYVMQSMDTWTTGHILFLEDEAKKMGFDVMGRIALSLTPGREMDALRNNFHEYIAGVISLPIRLPGTTFSNSLKAKERMARMIRSIIERRKEEGIGGESRDLLDVLMKDVESSQGALPLEFITDNIISSLFPSEDSVGMLITLAVHFLSTSPLALNQLREENQRLKESLHIHSDDFISLLPFTQNVLNETLRLGNVVKGVIRRTQQDVQIKDYFIPKGWACFPFFRGCHLDAEVYPNPTEFNPWRWQEKIPFMNFAAFGGGPRYCAGVEMSRITTSIFLHHLVTRFRWEAHNDDIINFPFVKMARRLPLILHKT